MKYAVRYAGSARDDIKRLYAYLLDRDENTAARAISVIEGAMKMLADFPFSCRKASSDNAFLRELVIPFGSSGYVALFEIEDSETVTILAIRHQREEDYH
ncbi:type II toxin-antitoxin system RelE/ParE family toxin [Rhizobium sp. BK602]|uniref:type II toxin-antitoxin system RelE/ParE family toxin n=1 Tax=Rhizobium sp. BK602 TaxID=2586986 RepID=UPI001614229C|nr:type II toxin-antitoxin system RelE/ParE family toxin [Rhizobium sp. BK602]MBB3608713.1 plasmid stabilization system protein ParE [Rhizobium sp. BK602]